jgi:Leucine-rich repeat (LRR) protein
MLLFIRMRRTVFCSDVSPQAGLTNLQDLKLNDNQISDISLSGLTNLLTLDLNDNQITDVSPLAGLTSLRLRTCNLQKSILFLIAL